jgi:protein-L-isoaspartate(D-aspartate) O-methyltransferase
MRDEVVTSAELLAAKQHMLRVDLRGRGIRDPHALEAIAKVPRERFVPVDVRHEAYADNAMAIGAGQTISQPFMVALMTEALELTGSERVLEIGTGSGYQTAILAEIVREVVSIERIPDLSRRAVEVLESLGYSNVTALVADGTLGHTAKAPYDRILVTAGAERVPPALLDQLDDEGLLVMPVGGADSQRLHVVRRKEDRFQTTSLTACRFVPLVGEQGWPVGFS